MRERDAIQFDSYTSKPRSYIKNSQHKNSKQDEGPLGRKGKRQREKIHSYKNLSSAQLPTMTLPQLSGLRLSWGTSNPSRRKRKKERKKERARTEKEKKIERKKTKTK